MASGDLLAQFWPLQQTTPKTWCSLPFTSGGTTAIVAGNIITGATSGATAVVVAVRLRSGTWAGGDAAGYFIIKSPTGTFQSENLNVGASSNLATISGASAQNLSAMTFTGGRWVIGLDSANVEFVVFEGILPPHYGAGGGTLTLNYQMSSANTSKEVVLDAFVMPIADGDSPATDAFDDDGNEDTTTESVPNAAGEFDPASITIADAQMPAASQRCRLLIARDSAASADTAAGDWQFDSAVLVEA